MLNKQEIENVLVGALEGGSNYWYWIERNDMNKVRQLVSKEADPCNSTAIAKAIDLGLELPIYDYEDISDCLGVLSKKSIREGIKRSIDDEREEVYMVKNGYDDAETADILFQYFVMKEIVFG